MYRFGTSFVHVDRSIILHHFLLMHVCQHPQYVTLTSFCYLLLYHNAVCCNIIIIIILLCSYIIITCIWGFFCQIWGIAHVPPFEEMSEI